jgi:hypothetical protein
MGKAMRLSNFAIKRHVSLHWRNFQLFLPRTVNPVYQTMYIALENRAVLF